MFVGHYAPALALKARFREVPLWQLFLAAQAVDVLFWTLVPLGVERVELVPGQSGPLALSLSYMPWSHSLLATLAFAGAVVAVGRNRAAVALGLAVGSHWFADLLVHTPDLPVAAGDGLRVGLGLWRWPVAAYVAELGVLLAAFRLGWQGRRRELSLVGALVVAQTLFAFVLPPPPSVVALAVATQVSYFGFAVAAWWAER